MSPWKPLLLIYAEGHGLLHWTIWLFGICVLLSIGCASWAVGASAQLFRRLETLQCQRVRQLHIGCEFQL